MKSDVPGILVVDDSEVNRYTLELLLKADGHERVVSAKGGKEALAFLEAEKFSLVLLDMMMPDLNGDEVLKIIKSKAETRDTPVVMISADTETKTDWPMMSASRRSRPSATTTWRWLVCRRLAPAMPGWR